MLEPPGYGTAHLEDLCYAIGKEMENAKKEIIKQIAESENVSFELAEWWFNKNMKLVLDFSDFRKIKVRSEFKSVDELLYDIDVETEYDRKMEKELIESTLGKVKR